MVSGRELASAMMIDDGSICITETGLADGALEEQELGAEDIARDAARSAEERLDALPGELRIGLVLADDAAGGLDQPLHNGSTVPVRVSRIM